MTDRELLELAAKAAGESFSHKLDDAVQGKRTGPFVVRRQRWTQWNPLTDDGDALRLAVRLKLDILFSPDVVEAMANTMKAVEPFGIEKYGDDENAATRRAIVRAAAEIGRAME